MLVRSLFCAGWNQTGQRAFFFFFFASGTFLRESVQLCHPQEGSPRHADPTGDSGLLSGSLSTVSLSFLFLYRRPVMRVLCGFSCNNTHFSLSTSENLWLGPDVLQTRHSRVQEAVCVCFFCCCCCWFLSVYEAVCVIISAVVV